jgi:hypothetical protein
MGLFDAYDPATYQPAQGAMTAPTIQGILAFWGCSK